MRSAPPRRRPPSSLYHCVARGPSGGSRACTSAVSKQRPPRKCRSSAMDTSASGGRSQTETSSVGPGESVAGSRTNAKVWSHSKKAPRRASRVDAWWPPAATRTWGCAPAGSPRARTTRTNKYGILSTRSCLLCTIGSSSWGGGGANWRTGIDTCRGIRVGVGSNWRTGIDTCRGIRVGVGSGGGLNTGSSSGGFSSDAATASAVITCASSGASVAGSESASDGFSVVAPSPADASAGSGCGAGAASTSSSALGGSSAEAVAVASGGGGGGAAASATVASGGATDASGSGSGGASGTST
uniref:Uncharacterized protein n=1 Tax=Zea mays TaxID=4577 RepID=C4J5F6_MAIZE|nr:unknown [Zea mays]